LKKITTVLIAFILTLPALVGCFHDKPNTDSASLEPSRTAALYFMSIRQAAWSDISEEEKNTVIGDWKTARVVEAGLSEMPVVKGGEEPAKVENLYTVTFETNKDALIGPIVVYVDGDTKEVLGYGVRH